MPAQAFPSDARERSSLAIRFAVGYSVLLHVILVLVPLRERVPLPPAGGVPGPLTVRLEPLAPPSEAVEALSRATPVPSPAPPREILAMPPRPHPPQAARTAPAPPPEPVPAAEPRREPEFDMSRLIAANRARRRAWEESLAGDPAAAGGGAGSAVAGGLARNLASLSDSDGTGGVFRVLRVGARTAEFSFNGWRTESHRKWREVIEVDAGPGGDVERAIVRRMIALIRTHYTGNFNWESRRAGHVVVLSAAPEDNGELEDYLMREFFGTPLVKRGR